MDETVRANMQHFEAVLRVAENEHLVASWCALIALMRADGLDVTVARDLLKTFEDDLEDRKRELGMF